jgi:sugar lactone lactonase YvrE
MKLFLFSKKTNMLSKRHFLFLFVSSVLFISSCEETLQNTSTDFTKENEFTGGIEGPATDANGTIYAVNFKEEGTIGKIDAKGNTSLFIKLPNGSIGNGIRFDKNGTMYIADYKNHTILQIKKGANAATIFASDSTMNQPNDVAISPNGALYASDPNWKESTGNIWMTKNNKLVLLESNMGTTNGIEVSPNGKTLYVNESVQRKIWKYDIQENGSITNKQQFASFTDFGLDGMRCDNKGNLYVCRYDKGTVAVFSPVGKLIREVQLTGKKPTNITFGGKDDKHCFITLADRGCLETFEAENSGKSF